MLRYPARLLFGEDAEKTAFATSVELGLPRMYTERHISVADHRYWVQFTTLFASADEVRTALPIPELRLAAEKAPENMATLVEVLAMHLESLVNNAHFTPRPTRNPGGFRALLASTAAPAPIDGRNRIQEALNCCRVLMRVIPVLYESHPASDVAGDTESLERRALWTLHPRTRPAPGQQAPSKTKAGNATENDGDRSQQFVLMDDDDSMQIDTVANDEAGTDPLANDTPSGGSRAAAAAAFASPDPLQNPSPTDDALQVRTGHALLDTIVDLLFHAGFTIPWTDDQLDSTESEARRVHLTIWEAGIGSPEGVQGTSEAHIEHRSEVLRLLLAVLSKPIYASPGESTADQHALEYVACSMDRPLVLAFLCSLMNTVCQRKPDEGWSVLGSGTDPVRDHYLSLCLQTLGAVLTFAKPGRTNLFVYYVEKLYRETDFAFLAGGIGQTFSAAATTNRGAFELGNASGSVFAKPSEEHVSEMLVMLWVLLRNNAAYFAYLVEDQKRSVDMLSWLLFVALANKDAPPSLSQAQLALFILQDLTADSRFCAQLASAQSGALLTVPARLLRRHGAVAMDAVVEGIFMLFTHSAGLMAPMYPTLLMILRNTAPSWRNLSMISAARLEQMLQQFASPRFLLAHDGNPRLLGILLDAFALIFRDQDQFVANANVVYILVRSAPIVDRLQTFRLDDALESMYRVREGGRMDRDTPRPTPPAKDAPTTNPTSPDMQSQTSVLQMAKRLGKKVEGLSEEELMADFTAMDLAEINAAAHEAAASPDLAVASPTQNHAAKSSSSEPNKDTTSEGSEKAEEPSPKEPGKEDEAPEPLSKGDQQVVDAPPEHDTIQGAPGAPSGQDITQDTADAPEQHDAAADAAPTPPCVPSKDPVLAPPPRAHLDAVAMAVGKHGFVPTEAWVEQWRPTLHVDAIAAALHELVPRVNTFCADPTVTNSVNADEKVLAFLREETLPASLPALPVIHTHAKLFELRYHHPTESTIDRALDSIVSMTSGLLRQVPFFGGGAPPESSTTAAATRAP